MTKKSNYILIFAAALFLTTFLMITAAAAVDYEGGFEWRKVTDYTNGTVNGSTVGNPNLDQNGNPAWSYESFDKDLLNWDSSSLAIWLSWGRWGSPDSFVNFSLWDQNTGLNTNNNNTGLTSLVRWINPTGESIDVDITGGLRTVWAGDDNGSSPGWTASPTDVKVVLGYYDFSEGTSSLLIDNTYSSPISQDTFCLTWGECPFIFTSFERSLSVDAGDSLFWTTIALDSTPGKNRWLTSTDGSIRITLVPEPVSSALFIIGASVLGIRRMRSAKVQ